MGLGQKSRLGTFFYPDHRKGYQLNDGLGGLGRLEGLGRLGRIKQIRKLPT